MFNLENYPRLETKEGTCGGRPIIKNSRIEPWHLIGLTLTDINECIPYLTELEIRDALKFYEDNKEEYEEYLNKFE